MLRETECSATRLFLKLVDGEVITCYINTYTYSGLLTTQYFGNTYFYLHIFCFFNMSYFLKCVHYSTQCWEKMVPPLCFTPGEKNVYVCTILHIVHNRYSQNILKSYLLVQDTYISRYIYLSCQCHSDSKFHINLLTTKSGFEISTSIPQSTAR